VESDLYESRFCPATDYLINIDKDFAKEIDPVSYYKLTSSILEKSEIDI